MKKEYQASRFISKADKKLHTLYHELESPKQTINKKDTFCAFEIFGCAFEPAAFLKPATLLNRLRFCLPFSTGTLLLLREMLTKKSRDVNEKIKSKFYARNQD
uniref:Uncharacterized protein n=1 Tax=Romanomermis culicivorax TaxID=13658 RepID=A0A915K5P2_ROMCU